jgi:hypothetical protein
VRELRELAPCAGQTFRDRFFHEGLNSTGK